MAQVDALPDNSVSGTGDSDGFAGMRAAVGMLFDERWYIRKYADVRLSALNPFVHYARYGAAEGRSPHPLFDTRWYVEQYGAGIPDGVNPLVHFCLQGGQSGLSPTPLFDAAWYLAVNDDVREANINPLVHYLEHGERENRNPSPLFATRWYRQEYSTHLRDRDDCLTHFATIGSNLGFQPNPLFKTTWYRDRHPESIDFAGGPLGHYALCGTNPHLQPHPLFDSGWYLRTYTDVAKSGANPLGHYLSRGRAERRSPGPFFDPSWYLSRYGNHIPVGTDPLVHYIKEGAERGFDPHPIFSTQWYCDRYLKSEGIAGNPLEHFVELPPMDFRSPSPYFNVDAYLGARPDVHAAGINPLLHFLTHGCKEGKDYGDTLRHLSPDYRLGSDLWAAITQRWIASALARPLARKSLKLTIIIVETAECHLRDLLTTCESLRSMHAYSAVDVKFALWREVDGTVIPLLAPDVNSILGRKVGSAKIALEASELAFVLAAGDKVHEKLQELLMRNLDEHIRLALFDTYSRSGNSVLPVFLPGINPYFAAGTCYFEGRFVIDAGMLASFAGPDGRLPLPANVGQMCLMNETKSKFGRTSKHLDLPLVETKAVKQNKATRKAPRPSLPSSQATVSVIISTKDNANLMEQLLHSIEALRDRIAEVIVISNHTTRSDCHELLSEKSAEGKIILIKHDQRFNFSRQSNLGADRATGSHLLFLNDDIVPIGPDWLEALLEPFDAPETAISGPLLIYPDERIQHAGMYASHDGKLGHMFRYSLPDSPHPLELPVRARNVGLVTGAVMLFDRNVFRELNGFDENLGTYLQDVDICLRARECGHEVVYTPTSKLFHLESVSMKPHLPSSAFHRRREREYAWFMRRWGAGLNDPYFNSRFEPDDESLRTLRLF